MDNHMSNDILSEKINDLQNEFIRRLHVHGNASSSNPPLLLRLIHDSSQDLLEYAFGQFGTNLLQLTKVLDMSHPDLATIFDGNFSDNQNFAKKCMQFLAMAEYAKNNQLNEIFPWIGSLFVKESLDKTVIKKIDNANYNKSYVRLILDSEEREAIRFCKKMQIIDLQNFYKKSDELWNAQTDNFKQFIRYDSAYMRELKQAEKKMKRYQELGCHSLASEIAKSIGVFRENMEQTYYGFNRITMTNAAIILAKCLGYTYSPAYQLHAGEHIMRMDAQIKVPRIFFKNYFFDHSLDLNTVYDYEPKVYPFHEVVDIAPEQVMQTIKLLESFPEANDKPIFDHFGVIVPSISYKNHIFKNESGLLQDCGSQEECSKELDKVFIKNKYIYPIIIGEKDGKCFFICYWA